MKFAFSLFLSHCVKNGIPESCLQIDPSIPLFPHLYLFLVLLLLLFFLLLLLSPEKGRPQVGFHFSFPPSIPNGPGRKTKKRRGEQKTSIWLSFPREGGRKREGGASKVPAQQSFFPLLSTSKKISSTFFPYPRRKKRERRKDKIYGR